MQLSLRSFLIAIAAACFCTVVTIRFLDDNHKVADVKVGDRFRVIFYTDEDSRLLADVYDDGRITEDDIFLANGFEPRRGPLGPYFSNDNRFALVVVPGSTFDYFMLDTVNGNFTTTGDLRENYCPENLSTDSWIQTANEIVTSNPNVGLHELDWQR